MLECVDSKFRGQDSPLFRAAHQQTPKLTSQPPLWLLKITQETTTVGSGDLVWRATHGVLTILYGGWRQHVVTNVHRSDTPAPLTGGQEQAVKHHHLVPKVISALIYPGERKELCSIKKTISFYLLICCFIHIFTVLTWEYLDKLHPHWKGNLLSSTRQHSHPPIL